MTEALAIHGGPRTISEKFSLYNSYGKEEMEAAREVVESGVLSRFLGGWHEDFFGGEKVRIDVGLVGSEL